MKLPPWIRIAAAITAGAGISVAAAALHGDWERALGGLAVVAIAAAAGWIGYRNGLASREPRNHQVTTNTSTEHGLTASEMEDRLLDLGIPSYIAAADEGEWTVNDNEITWGPSTTTGATR